MDCDAEPCMALLGAFLLPSIANLILLLDNTPCSTLAQQSPSKLACPRRQEEAQRRLRCYTYSNLSLSPCRGRLG